MRAFFSRVLLVALFFSVFFFIFREFRPLPLSRESPQATAPPLSPALLALKRAYEERERSGAAHMARALAEPQLLEQCLPAAPRPVKAVVNFDALADVRVGDGPTFRFKWRAPPGTIVVEGGDTPPPLLRYALERGAIPAETVCNAGLTVFVAREAVSNVFHAHFDSLRTLRQWETTVRRVVFLPPDKGGGPWLSLYQRFLPGAPQLVDGRTAYRGKVCFERAVFLMPEKRELEHPPKIPCALAQLQPRQTAYAAAKHQLGIPALPAGEQWTFIARRSRVLPNRAEYLSVLPAHTKVLYAEDLTLDEMLLEMRRTRVLIGAHGAGLTNAIFLSPGAYLIELHAGPYYQQLAHDNGLVYLKARSKHELEEELRAIKA